MITQADLDRAIKASEDRIAERLRQGKFPVRQHAYQHAQGGIDRLTPDGGPPTGVAGGELNGTYPNPSVDATHAGSAHHAAVTAGNGIGVTGQVVALGNLTADWTPTGAFDIVLPQNFRVAGYGRFGSTSAPTNTGAGYLTVTRLYIADDSNFFIVKVGSNPAMFFDSNDYFGFNRTTNEFSYAIGGSAVAGFLATHMYHTTGLVVGASSAPNASALLEIAGNGKGLLLPRMATAQAPVAGADGLIWYDSTTGKFRGREGGADVDLRSAASGDIATDTLWDALGDLAYGTGADTGGKLAGNITATKKFLRQTGDGAASAAPAWDTIADGDVPATHAGSTHHAEAHTLASHSTAVIDNLTDVDTTTDAPSLSDVLKWNGTNWVPAAYNYSFAFSIAAFTATNFTTTKLIGAGDWKAIGAVQFDASYNNMPGGMTAAVALTGSAADWSGLALAGATGPTTNATAITYPSTRTGTLTVTLTQSYDATTATDTQAFSNTMRYGTNANGIGAQTEANIEALSEVAGPNESRDQTISNIPTGTAGHYLTFAWGASLSDVAQVQMDSGYGFVTASFNATDTTLAPTVQTPVTNVANSAGFSESFDAITSRLANLPNNTNDFKLLTSATAQNYIYWGELNVASTADGAAVYTEANVEGNAATQPGKVASNSISSRSMIVNCAAGEYAYIAYPSRLGLLTSILIGGFESIGDFWIDHKAGSELAITNDAGYKENYYVYVSKNPSFTNPTTMTVSL